jgi:hypothetical protein
MKLAARLLAAASSITFIACSSAEDDDGTTDGGGDCSALVTGDLVITEVMANPAGEDRGFEYFEIYNASSAQVDLDGLTLAYSLADGSNEETHEVEDLVIEPGAYLALGTADPEALPEFVDYGFANDLGTLRNAGAALALRCGDTEVDRTEYPSAEGQDGIASVLDGAAAPDHLANDDVANYCPATTEFAPGLFGSPGEANEPCNPVVSGTCTDGDEERPLVVPEVGDLVISEFMASPEGADDTNEWFEVYVGRTVDLNGLVAGREVGDGELLIDSAECQSVETGTYVVFARALAGNGGLPPVAGEFGFSLVPSGAMFVGVGDLVLDEIAWTQVTDGASTALDPAELDPEANDDEANWFACAAEYDPELGNRGTPGASNADCEGGGKKGTCMDGGTPRPIVPPTAGQILVTEALANPANPPVGDFEPEHEWFEISALASFDLNGLEIGRLGGVEQTLAAAECLTVKGGDRLVFAESTDAGENGGLPQVDFIKDITLNNSGGAIFVGVDGQVLHTFSYGNAADARSRQLDPDGVTICSTPETTPYGSEANVGTPGAANPDCPP